MDRSLNQASPYMLSALRIVVGLLFLEHGTQKLFGFPSALGPGPALYSLLGLQGVMEVVGGALILVGLFTRQIAFVLAGNMAVAYFMSHAPASFFPVLNRGDAAVLYCFIFLYLFFAGGGPWSLDNARIRKRRER